MNSKIFGLSLFFAPNYVYDIAWMSTYNLAMFSVAKTVPVGLMKHYGALKADFIIQKAFLQFRNCLPLSEPLFCTRKTTFSIL